VLDRVVVTGSAISAAPEREPTGATDVLDGRRLARENSNTLAGALDAYVPGVWAWAHSPSSLMSSYASIRGASSFGLSYPKIYIDGIEVANPLLVGRFNPGSIDHIEVIRGPQGSALYGMDAISGVVNIVTRHEGAAPDGSIASLRTSAGVSQSVYAHNVLAQDHELSVTAGSDERSADLHVAGGSIGSFIPDGYSRDLMATGSARIVGERTTLSTTARVFIEQAGTPNSPLIASGGPPSTTAARYVGSPMRGSPMQAGLAAPNEAPQSVSEYTIGASATTSPNDRWTHSFIAGIDGYRLSNVQTNFTPIPSIVDSALRAAEGGADRATLRASSEMHFSSGARTRGTMTFAAEHSTLRMATTADVPSVFIARSNVPGGLHLAMPGVSRDERVTSWQNSTGLIGQTSFSWNDAFFATGGVRLERDSRLVATGQIEALPMLGAASVRQVGPLTVKLRAAYGEGIRPPTTLSSTQLWQMRNNVPTQAPLGPERQSGIESGMDVSLRQALTFQITRFDQRASGLIQQVAIPMDDDALRRMTYVAQNVGEISNRGWELQATSNVATSNVSRLAITGALSFVDSRVEKLAPGYTGDLVTGDRMLQVPGRTGSVNVAWTSNRWFASLGGSRALDWINYDELALAQAFAGADVRPRDLTGVRLRDYWTRYDGGLHLRATTAHDIRDGFAIQLTADNLLNYQRGEPDNLTIVPGRTIMTGIRVKF